MPFIQLYNYADVPAISAHIDLSFLNSEFNKLYILQVECSQVLNSTH